MFKRGITVNEILEGINKGIKIKDYPDEKPYPSCLILHFVDQRPIHIVISQEVNREYVISLQLMFQIRNFGM
jgi:hypothetical protein